jgi:hypothetical protein
VSLAWLAPAALVALATLAGPVLAHLARQHPRERVAFGAMMLLDRVRKRVERRHRLRDRLLLLLRLVAVAAAVLAAASPELRLGGGVPAFGGTGRVVVVLDESLSMDQRSGADPVFAEARRAAADLLRGLPPEVQVGLVTAGGSPEALTDGLAGDPAVVASFVESRERGDGPTDLHGALVLARSMLGGEPGEVVVFTDEAGPGVVDACAIDFQRLLATGSAVIPRVYRAAPARNVAPVGAAYGEGVEGGSVTVTLRNWGADAREVPATVILPDGTRITAFAQVPGATAEGPGSVETRFTVPRQAEGGVARVEVEDSDLPADNVRYFHLPRIGASRVMVVDGDPGATASRSEVYFLARALAPWGGGGPAVDVVTPAGLGALDPAVHRVVWLANVADPGPIAPGLADFVRKGGGLVLTMGENVAPDAWNGPLEGLLPMPLRRTRDLSGRETLAPPDTVGDPLWTPFSAADPGLFERVSARRVMTLAEDAAISEAQTRLRWAGGLPALVTRQVGPGTVALWTSTVDTAWGDFPVEAAYPLVVQRLTGFLGGSVGGLGATASGEVGTAMQIDLPPGEGEAVLIGPGGEPVGASRSGSTLRFLPAHPGEYRVERGPGPPVARIAVNTPVAESDVRPSTPIVEAQAAADPERMSRRLALGPLFGVLAALALVGQAWAKPAEEG